MNTPDDPNRDATWAPPTAPAPAPGAASSADPARRGSRRPLLVLGVVAVLVAGGVWLVVGRSSGGGGGVAVAEGDVEDAEQVLAATTEEFLAVAGDTGATVGEDAGCYWMTGPANPEDGGSDDIASSVACGPARFAAGGNWLVAPIDSSVDEDEQVTVSVPLERGSFASGDDIGIGADHVEFVGVDGAQPEDVELDEPASDQHAVLPDGRIIENVGDLVETGLSLVTKRVGGEPLNVHEGADCWITREGTAVGEDGSEISGPSLLCGPVLGLEDDPTMPFQLVAFSTGPGAGPWSAVADTTSLSVSQPVALPEGIGLFHPDGAEVPSTDSFTNPDPAAVAADYLGVAVASELADLPFEDLTASTVKTPDFDVALDGTAIVERIGTGPNALIAPDGQQLIAFRYKATPVEDETYVGVDDSSTALVLAVDGEPRELQLGDMTGINDAYVDGPVYDTYGETLVIVAAVPADAADVTLEVQNRGVAQSLSLTTGKANSAVPGLDRHGDEIALTERFDIDVTSPRARQHEYPPEGTGYFRGTVNKATIRSWDDERRWAPDGKIFVDVDVSEVDEQLDTDYSWEAAFDWSRTVTLVLPGGKTVKATGVSSELDAYQPEVLRFAVPVDTTRVTLRIAPTGMAQYYDGVEYPLAIDAASETPITLRR